MKIKELEQHCGNCGITEYCGNPFCYCLCHDERFQNLDDEEYRKMAEGCKCGNLTYEKCVECYEDDCSECEHEDDSKDFLCEQIADAVYSQFPKMYFFTMTRTHHRTGEHIGKTVGIVRAFNEEDAENKAWDKFGSDMSYKLQVQEFDAEEGFSFTVYKSEI